MHLQVQPEGGILSLLLQILELPGSVPAVTSRCCQCTSSHFPFIMGAGGGGRAQINPLFR